MTTATPDEAAPDAAAADAAAPHGSEPRDTRPRVSVRPVVETADSQHGEVTVIDDREGYLAAVEAIRAGTGPVSIDAERASGYRYSQRAYLIQVFRRGSGVFLLDPPAIGSFAELQAVIGDEEWVLHAASQDHASLR